MTTSLIDELQLDASNSAVAVSDLLRKALVVAAKLEVADVPEWINRELSGYTDAKNLPSYRVLYGKVMARGQGGWLPVQFPTSEFDDTVSKRVIFESVAEIESLMGRDETISFGFSPEPHQLLQTMFRQDTEFTCFISRARLHGIIDAVRNQVLQWAIALDKAGVRGAGLSFTREEKEKAHSVVVHNNGGTFTIGVLGNVGGQANVATGSQPRAGNISSDEIQALVAAISPYLTSLQLPSGERSELETALTELQAPTSAKESNAAKVYRALARVLGVIGKAGETVITVGVRAYVEAWMKQHGVG
jgi:hypothetical protein